MPSLLEILSSQMDPEELTRLRNMGRETEYTSRIPLEYRKEVVNPNAPGTGFIMTGRKGTELVPIPKGGALVPIESGAKDLVSTAVKEELPRTMFNQVRESLPKLLQMLKSNPKTAAAATALALGGAYVASQSGQATQDQIKQQASSPATAEQFQQAVTNRTAVQAQQAPIPSTFAYNVPEPVAPDLGPQTSPLVALLANLGRLAGNIAGAATGKGAAGESMAPQADALMNRMYQEQAVKSQALQQFEEKVRAYKKESKQAEDVFKLAGKEPNERIRAMAQQLTQSGYTKEAIGLLESQEKLRQQLAIYMDKKDLAKEDREYIKRFFEANPGIDLNDPAQVTAGIAGTGAPATSFKALEKAIKDMTPKTGGFLGFGGSRKLSPEAAQALQLGTRNAPKVTNKTQSSLSPYGPGWRQVKNQKGQLAWQNIETGEIKY